MGVEEGAVEVEDGEGYHFEKGFVQLKSQSWLFAKNSLGEARVTMSNEIARLLLG